MSAALQPVHGVLRSAVLTPDRWQWGRVRPAPLRKLPGAFHAQAVQQPPQRRPIAGSPPSPSRALPLTRRLGQSWAGLTWRARRRQARQDRWAQQAQAEGAVATEAESGDEAEECELVLGKELQLGRGEASFAAHLAEAVKNRNGAGVLLLPDILGHQNADTRDFAYRLACFGYSVLVPDLFRGEPWESARSKSEYEEWRTQHSPERVAADIATAGEYLRTSVVQDRAAPGDGRLAVLGFCFGGGRLVETLAHDTANHYSTGVFFYGTRFDPSLASSIKVPLLLITGDSDDLCSVDTVKLIEGQVAGSQAMVFPGRGHAFAHHPGSMEEDDDAEAAFQAATRWLQKQLLAGTPQTSEDES